MKFELFDFQKTAVNDLLHKMLSMQNAYHQDQSLTSLSLTAPTGAGKTVMTAAAIEGLFYGNEDFEGDPNAIVLWLSDSPSLNGQTMKRFEQASDLLNPSIAMESIGPDFAKSHKKLSPGKVYFLNRQLLSAQGKLVNPSEGGRTFYEVLKNTIEDPNRNLYMFIDEAHRGLGSDGTSDTTNKTIYNKLINGIEDVLPPMPVVVGISATPGRFDRFMDKQTNRDLKAPVRIEPSSVRKSGLIKDTIELRTPKTNANSIDQDLTLAAQRLNDFNEEWRSYCESNDIFPVVTPLMVVQVEDKVTDESLDTICRQIRKVLPNLDPLTSFANVFGEHRDIKTATTSIPYCAPDDISGNTDIRILFAKDAISTGWDCPRAEVIYSKRRRKDATYIAQLIGRMIRNPLARRIPNIEELNVVACYLPQYDAETVNEVVTSLKNDGTSEATNSITINATDVGWFGEIRKGLTTEGLAEAPAPEKPTVISEPVTGIAPPDTEKGSSNGNGDIMGCPPEDDDNTASDKPEDILKRLPDAKQDEVADVFESIISRQIRHSRPDALADLWESADIIMADLDDRPDFEQNLFEEFSRNVDAEINRYPAQFKRAVNELRNRIVSIQKYDSLTKEALEINEIQVENDDSKLVSNLQNTYKSFRNSDAVKYYVKRCIDNDLISDKEAIYRICAAGNDPEIRENINQWAENKTKQFLDIYGPQRSSISEENKAKWDKIEGNVLPYVERTLSISGAITSQDRELEKYPKHLICDDAGWAYFNLRPLEKKVVYTELARPITAAWYRNEARSLNASLCIPYELNGAWENMYPDFIFFDKKKSGELIPAIVDPHGDWLGDSIAKLQGYVKYLQAHPNLFGRVQAVTEIAPNNLRYLDLTLPGVQNAILTYTDNTARGLFTGPYSHTYVVSEMLNS